MLTFKGRIFTIKVFFVCIFLIIIYRLFTIQILDVFKLYGEYNRYKDRRIVVPADRGIIYDCNGIILAENKKLFKLDLCPAITHWSYTDTMSGEGKQKIYQKIAETASKYTKKSSKFYTKKIRNFATKYPNGFELETNLDATTGEAIISQLKANNIMGVTCYKQSSERVYPNGGVAGPLIGLCSSGKAVCGIEQAFNKDLTGEDGWLEVIQYGTGKDYHFKDMAIQKAVEGNSVYLTIDTHIQSILEKNLKDGIRNYKARNAIGIIVSPKNGNILAMGGTSAKNMNAPNRIIHSMPIFPIDWLFEPGSTMKPVTALLALEKDLFKSNDMIDCHTRQIGRRTISDVHHFPELTFKEIITYSSNVGITHVVDKLSRNDLYKRLIELGFGHKTGIRLNGESSGILRPPSQWSKYTLHSLSFGQEISVTALQLVFAYCALANGGELLEPHIIKEIKKPDGQITFKSHRKVIRTISNKNALDTLRTFLQSVVEDGYGKTARLSCVNIAGKTGTAEKKKEDGIGYKEDKYISSFVGFFPIEDPQIVMLIIFDEPDYEHRYGSISAAPIFKRIAEEIIVMPSLNLLSSIKQINQDYILVPNCIGMPVGNLKNFLSEKNISYSILGNGSIVTDQFPKPGTTILENFSILLISDETYMSRKES